MLHYEFRLVKIISFLYSYKSIFQCTPIYFELNQKRKHLINSTELQSIYLISRKIKKLEGII